ncbi:hypothetical protein MBLNU459_g5037t2 [Dothideomycetes sp. NU459]
MSDYTSAKEFDQIYSTLNATFKSGKTKSLAWRKWQLKQLWWMVEDNEDAIVQALSSDLNRHKFESYAADIHSLKSDILEHIKNLERWAADEYVEGAGFIMGTLGKARIRKEPLGVGLIIGAWNFPFLLVLQPLIAAVTAGCCVLMKPSELATASQNLLLKLTKEYLDPAAISLITGGPKETAYVLEHKFDHIFFTGSSKIARFVTAAAAKHLTPTVLELGGQGPAIVAKSANVDLAAKRISYAKFLNAGQICLSVNHVFVDPDVYAEFIDRLAFWNKTFLSEGDMCQIVNERNFDRLAGLLKMSRGRKIETGQSDRSTCRMQPTIVADVKPDDAIMTEELFGPIAPIIKATYQQAYSMIQSMPHPLAIYIFSNKQSEVDEILDNTISGGVTINDVMMHASVHGAPFGGVGESGYGYYHGAHGFKCFTHTRIIVEPPAWLERLISFRYPPFDAKHISKIAVTNKLGFRRGETMEDQKIKKVGGTAFSTKIIGSLMMLALFAAISGRPGRMWLFAQSLKDHVNARLVR